MGIGEIGESLRRSTVQIRSAGLRDSAGSGVIWKPEGMIITNAHVLGRGEHVVNPWVELWDGRCLRAALETRDDQRDLAKLKVSANGLPAAAFRKDPPRPGELVIAVGNPLGFTGALTTGVVHAAGPFSGLGRRRWVQAAIRLAPGNSGGPLADAAGKVVGINTMIVSGGIALAIPAATIEEFVRDGPSPRLGVTIRPVRLSRRSGLGLLILGIDPGSLAERASLFIGDVLIGAGSSAFASPADLSDAIEDARSGLLKLRFVRGDSAREREVAISFSGRFTREAA